MSHTPDEQKKRVFFWKKYEISLKSLISSMSCGAAHLFISTYSGSVYIYQLPQMQTYCFLTYKEISEPISKIVPILDKAHSCEIFAITRNGSIFYIGVEFKENMDAKNEFYYAINSKVLSKSIEGDNELIEAIFKPNANIFLFVSRKNIIFGIINNEKKHKSLEQEKIIYTTEEVIDQVSLSGAKLLISTGQNYYVLNIFSEAVIKIGTKEKKSFFGACFLSQENTEEHVYAGRVNGIIWHADPLSGKVLNSIQFIDEKDQKISLGRLYQFDNLVLSLDNNNLYLIDVREKQLITKEDQLSIISSFVRNSDEKAFLSSKKKLINSQSESTAADSSKKPSELQERSTLVLLCRKGDTSVIKFGVTESLSEAFEKYIKLEDLQSAAELFCSDVELQSYESLQKIFRKNKFLLKNLPPNFSKIANEIEVKTVRKIFSPLDLYSNIEIQPLKNLVNLPANLNQPMKGGAQASSVGFSFHKKEAYQKAGLCLNKKYNSVDRKKLSCLTDREAKIVKTNKQIRLILKAEMSKMIISEAKRCLSQFSSFIKKGHFFKNRLVKKGSSHSICNTLYIMDATEFKEFRSLHKDLMIQEAFLKKIFITESTRTLSWLSSKSNLRFFISIMLCEIDIQRRRLSDTFRSKRFIIEDCIKTTNIYLYK